MSMAAWIVLQQSNVPAPESSTNTPIAAFVIIGLIAAVVGMFVLVFIRTSARRAPRQ
jgi:hypothetical protein